MPSATLRDFIDLLDRNGELTRIKAPVSPILEISEIADRYNTPLATIKSANELRGNTIRAGDYLMIPVASKPLADYSLSADERRSQTQNRERAMQILKARLFEMERKKQEAQLATLKGENVDAGWGNQIRSYVLHPYHMVKDHRTNHEIGNTGAVLDGRLNDFMEAYLRSKVRGLSLDRG